MVEWSIFNEIFAVAFNVLYFVIIIGTIFIVILDNRNPVKTMAWVLLLPAALYLSTHRAAACLPDHPQKYKTVNGCGALLY